jgi:hypothetical protein
MMATSCKVKNIGELQTGINEFKRGYQPRSNLLKDVNGDLLADSHNIMNRKKNYFFQLLNVHRVNDVRQIEIHTTELLAPEHSPYEFQMAIVKLKKYKLSGSDQILAEMI